MERRRASISSLAPHRILEGTNFLASYSLPQGFSVEQLKQHYLFPVVLPEARVRKQPDRLGCVTLPYRANHTAQGPLLAVGFLSRRHNEQACFRANFRSRRKHIGYD